MSLRLGTILFLCVLHTSAWAESVISLGDWQRLSFVTKPVLNQHLFLYELARDEAYFKEVVDELLCAEEPELGALLKAVDAYKASGVSDRVHPLFANGPIPAMTDAAMRGQRIPEAECSDICQAIENTRSVYMKWFWPAHLQTNQNWAKQVIAKLHAHGEPIQARLETLYKRNLVEDEHVIDVVFKPGDIRGAWTSGRTPRTVINSSQPGYRDWHALEMVFHEVAHHRLTARAAPMSVAIATAMGAKGIPQEKNIWHALMFFSVGEVVKAQIASEHPDYEAYADAQDVYSRGWAKYRSVLGRYWPAYLNGSTTLEEALDRLAVALSEDNTQVTTTLHKKPKGWQVTYTLNKPAHEIVMLRNPDKQRTNRWQSATPGVHLVQIAGADRIARRDGQAFESVTFNLDASYYSPPKEYAPFSPFTDGGMSIHSGRFFACVTHCEDKNQWAMRVLADKDDTILVAGEQFVHQASWQDSDSGQSLYVGQQRVTETPYFFAVIDSGLPDSVTSVMEKQLPRLVDFYATRLGAIKQKGMLYASYSPGDANEFQGGVIGNQVFVHFNGDASVTRADPVGLFWFFSHEVAHRFQKSAGAAGDRNHAWIHEGGAEWLAFESVSALMPEAKEEAERRLGQSLTECQQGLQDTPFKQAAEHGKHRLFYTCGMHLNRVIAEDVKRQGHSYFSAWQAYQRAVDEGSAASEMTLLAALRPMLAPETYRQLRQFAQATPKQANAVLLNIIEEKD